MVDIAHAARPVLLALFIGILLNLSSCSGRQNITPPTVQPPTGSLENALDQLDELAVPVGADPADFERLRAALHESLAAKSGSAIDPAPPTSDGSQAMLSWDEASSTLSWYYANCGDYDQNGLVGVSDLTPLGVHYGKTADLAQRTIFEDLISEFGASPFGLGPVESVVDGNADGQIGISDITPIGQNYNAMVSGYRIYAGTQSSDYPAGNSAISTLEPLAELAFSEATGTAGSNRLHFSYTVPAPVPGMTYWVRPFYVNAEGTPSNAVGAGLEYPPGSLAITGVSPASAEPGELIWLEFSAPLADRLENLTVVINGLTDATVPVAHLAVQGARAGTAAPLLAPGPVSFEVFDDGSSIGTAQLTLLPPTTSLDVATVDQLLDESTEKLSTSLGSFFARLPELAPEVDDAAVAAELDDFIAALEGVNEYLLEELNALSPEDRTAVLCYIENSGYFDLLGGLGAEPHDVSRTTSQLSADNWQYLSLDMWSAATTNNAYLLDVVGLGAAVVSLGTGAPVLIAFKVVYTIIDNAIDTFIPTDLYDIRIESKRRELETSVVQAFKLEGQFAAEKPAFGGTLELFVETALAGLEAPPQFKEALLSEVVNNLAAKLGSKFVQTFWGGTLPVVSDPDDPCCGKIGGFWIPLDLQLYTSVDWSELSGQLIYSSYLKWMESYVAKIDTQPGRAISVVPTWAEVLTGASKDTIRFSHPGKYYVSVNAFTFNGTFSVGVFWSHTGMKEISVQVPFWVERFGDWANRTVGDDESNDVLDMYCWGSNGKPVILYQGWFCYHVSYGNDPLGTTWSTPIQILDDIDIMDLAIVNGLPTFLYNDNGRRLLQADNDLGTQWPEEGIEVAKTMRTSGTHSGEASNHVLIDGAGGFLTNGVEPGNFVELLDTGTIAKIASIVDNTELSTHFLPDGELFTPGSEYIIYRNDVRGADRYRLGSSGGVPVITYWDYAGTGYSDTYFVSAKDPQGREWNEPVLIGSDPGLRWPVIDVDGRPAYCSDSLTEGIYYRGATDLTGQNWGGSYQISGPGTFLKDFCEVNGSPAVLYVEDEDLPPGSEVLMVDVLNFRIADSGDGSSWLVPVEIARGQDNMTLAFMGDASLSVIHGMPAAAYFHSDYDLAYRAAEDMSGISWGNVELVEDSGDTIHLLNLGSNPGIFYHRNWDDDIRFSVPEL